MVSCPAKAPSPAGPFGGGSLVRIPYDPVAWLIRPQELRNGNRRHITSDAPVGLPAGLCIAGHLRNLFRTLQHAAHDVQNLCSDWEHYSDYNRVGLPG